MKRKVVNIISQFTWEIMDLKVVKRRNEWFLLGDSY